MAALDIIELKDKFQELLLRIKENKERASAEHLAEDLKRLFCKFYEAKQPLPEIISQSALISIYQLSPAILADFCANPMIMARIQNGNHDEEADAKKNWQNFCTKLQEEKASVKEAGIIFMHAKNFDIQSEFSIKSQVIVLATQRLGQYQKSGAGFSQLIGYQNDKEFFKKSPARGKSLLGEGNIRRDIDEFLMKQRAFELAFSRVGELELKMPNSKELVEAKQKLLHVAISLTTFLNAWAYRLEQTIEKRGRNTYKNYNTLQHPFFDSKPSKGKEAPSLQLLKSLHKAVLNQALEIRERHPEYSQISKEKQSKKTAKL